MSGDLKRRKINESNIEITRIAQALMNAYNIGTPWRDLPVAPDYKPGRVIPTKKMEKPATDTDLPFPDYEPISAPAQPSRKKIKLTVGADGPRKMELTVSPR